MNAPQPLGRYSTKRRTNRIAMTMKVGVIGTDRTGQSFTTSAKATNLNYHGATVILPQKLPVGAVVTIRNAQRVEADAKIVSQIGAYAGTHTYGVEFTADAAAFWGIYFPTVEAWPRRRQS